ncbi:hypothetical protein VCHA31O73_360036 [Vibrio chagasii]|nr:hypothetical protein VCHA31O73_360036 [Vibrio chagasii]
MATKKGAQIYLNDQDPAELDIIKWSETLGKGRKSLATIEAIIAGRAIARISQPITDLLVSAARRGEDVTLEQLEDYISMFKSHNVVKPMAAPIIESKAETPVDVTEEQLELEEEPKSGFDDLGS